MYSLVLTASGSPPHPVLRLAFLPPFADDPRTSLGNGLFYKVVPVEVGAREAHKPVAGGERAGVGGDLRKKQRGKGRERGKASERAIDRWIHPKAVSGVDTVGAANCLSVCLSFSFSLSLSLSLYLKK